MSFNTVECAFRQPSGRWGIRTCDPRTFGMFRVRTGKSCCAVDPCRQGTLSKEENKKRYVGYVG